MPGRSGQCRIYYALRAQEQPVSRGGHRSRGDRRALGTRAHRRRSRSAADGRGGEHGWQPPIEQSDRAIDWLQDDTALVLRKIHSADGAPGVHDVLLERRFSLFDAHREPDLTGEPGALIARRDGPSAAPRATALFGSGSCSPSILRTRSGVRPLRRSGPSQPPYCPSSALQPRASQPAATRDPLRGASVRSVICISISITGL